jgi:uncharacterized protein (TIGR03435 family)
MLISRNTCLAGVLALTAWTGWAQAPSKAAQKEAGCPPPVKFRAMSIHARDSVYEHLDGYTREGFAMTGATLRSVIEYGFLVQQIEGLPDWAQKQTYDVIAEINPEDCCRWASETPEEESLTVQRFLQDKLKLKWHRETRMVRGFDLVVGKKPAQFGVVHPGALRDPMNDLMDDLFDPSKGDIWENSGPVSMKGFATFLSTQVKHPVVDTTRLAGRYKFLVRYPRGQGIDSTRLIDPDGTPVQPPPGPTIFDDVERLGLELKEAKVPIDVLVIDEIERPAEN